MADRSADKWLGRIQDALEERVTRWSAAIDTVAATESERSQAVLTEADQVGVAFARFLAGTIDADELLGTLDLADPDAFWSALESFTDSVSGEERRRLASQLLVLPEVDRERRRLRHFSTWRRSLAARRLGLLGARAMCEPLREAMARGPEPVTLGAAHSLARLRDLPALSWLLEHPDSTAGCTRRRLAGLLWRFGPEAVGELRVAVAGWDAQAPIHLAAIDALGARRDLDSVKVLEEVLRDGRIEARVAAARALGCIGSTDAAPALVVALDDESWEVRAQAARALGEVPVAASVSALAGRVGDVAWWVRKHAAYALARHGAEGRRALEEIARRGHDLFASEMSGEALQRLEWEEEITGGVERVA